MPEEIRPADSATPAGKTKPAAVEKSPPPAEKPAAQPPARIYLVPYPKIILLYPILLAAVGAAIAMHLLGGAGDQAPGRGAVVVAEIFLGIAAVNLVILAFDFPRTTSLTLFFFVVAIVMSFILLVTFKPGVMPFLKDSLARLHPTANATFYWGIAAVMGGIYLAVFVSIRFDYWEIRPNELLHHHGMLSNLERLSAPNLRIEKEINDVFEYFLLRSSSDLASQRRPPADYLGQRTVHRPQGSLGDPDAGGAAGSNPQRRLIYDSIQPPPRTRSPS